MFHAWIGSNFFGITYGSKHINKKCNAIFQPIIKIKLWWVLVDIAVVHMIQEYMLIF